MKRGISDSSQSSENSLSSSSQSDGARNHVRQLAKAKYKAHMSSQKLTRVKRQSSRRETQVERLEETQAVNKEMALMFARDAAKKAAKAKRKAAEEKADKAKKAKCEKEQPFSRSTSENSVDHSDSSNDRKVIIL